MDLDLPSIPPRIHLTGEALEQFEAKVCAAYQRNPKISIRKIADATDRSYGAIHRLLKRHGILRPRGGANRGGQSASRTDATPAPGDTSPDGDVSAG